MRTISRYFKTTLLYCASVLLACGYPLTVFAEETPASSETTPATTPAQSSTTSEQPASTTQQPPAKPKETYTYDTSSGRWNTSKWQYDSSSKSYKPTTPPASVQPTEQAKTDAPTASTALTSPTIAPKTTTKSSSQGATNSTTNAAITNALESLANTGNADVTHNGLAGNATTGNAAATATVINNVNSTMTNGTNQEAATFVSDVIGDVNGDIMLQPMLLKAMLEAGTTNSNLTNTVNNNTTITNDLTLKAASGDASVTNNTKAGNATTGSANTVANVMNLLNSMIAANQSFVGTINIYGNLNGDILIAPDFIPQLLADNASTTKQSTSTIVNATDTQSIVNNVALAAESGKALVSGNTSAGNATTGSADTNLVIFNLSGHQIVASNSLLVFVNVLGKWVGVIVDAPSGATAAAIGNGVSTNTVTAPSMVVNAQNNTQITNNLDLASHSGDATVTGNTLAGNATTGNATASANIANIANSQIGLSGWFGVLFINVFGNWTGSFGVNTSAGNPIAVSGGHYVHNATKQKKSLRVFEFVPRPSAPHTGVLPTVVASNQPTSQAAIVASTHNPYVVLASHSSAPTKSKPANVKHINMPLTIASLLLVGISIFGLRRFLF